jgi:ABC-type Zn2+ transport system substrate-binding protein/surface adhesin
VRVTVRIGFMRSTPRRKTRRKDKDNHTKERQKKDKRQPHKRKTKKKTKDNHTNEYSEHSLLFFFFFSDRTSKIINNNRVNG